MVITKVELIERKKQVNRKYRVAFIGIVVVGILVTASVYLSHFNIPVLNPKGIIAEKERDLIIIGSVLSLAVVIPVFTMLFVIAWKYRASNTKATYEPEWDHNGALEALWWGIPCLIITILAVITWNATHELDPFKPIDSSVAPIHIQVVALDWKWLFIYPDQHIASVNFVQFPVNTPVDFDITSDAPMNSFWIPSLAGQIYAMSGMSTQLHLMADTIGSYNGSSANISGTGFAGMRFVARASTVSDFTTWVSSAARSSHQLGLNEYNTLAAPSQNNPVTLYALKQDDLYDTIVMKYMAPISSGAANNTDTQPNAMYSMGAQ